MWTGSVWGEGPGDQGVAGLVVGDPQLLVRSEHALLFLGAGDDSLDTFLELDSSDLRFPLASGEQGRLVDEVGQVGADESGGHRGDVAKVDLILQRDLARVDLEDLLAAGDVGAVNHDIAVEPARSDERGVEGLGPVGRGHDDHAEP